jgi:2-(1,2-epoxy-1,2-dihydrophenyl)acetyl-CoA isomerase
MSAPVQFRIADGIAWLTLARPETRNAIGPDLASALLEVATACAEDPAVRCVLLTGAGRFFSVGGDIDLFARAGDDAEAQIRDLAQTFHG